MLLHSRLPPASRQASNGARSEGQRALLLATLQRCRQPTRFPSVLRLAATEQEVAEAPAAPAAPARVPWWDKGAPPNSRNITGGIQQLVDELADAGDKLVVVEFYAPWCAACKAVYPKICQIMNELGDEVRFFKVSWEDNKDMCRTMGVKVLPTVHMYHGALGRVKTFTVTVSKIQRLRDALDEHLGAICSLEEPQALVEEFPEVHPHHPLILEAHADDMYEHGPVVTSPDVPTRLPV